MCKTSQKFITLVLSKQCGYINGRHIGYYTDVCKRLILDDVTNIVNTFLQVFNLSVKCFKDER